MSRPYLQRKSRFLPTRARQGEGEYKPYFTDRAQQCRKWIADLKEEGAQVDAEYIAGGLAEFEGLAL